MATSSHARRALVVAALLLVALFAWRAASPSYSYEAQGDAALAEATRRHRAELSSAGSDRSPALRLPDASPPRSASLARYRAASEASPLGSVVGQVRDADTGQGVAHADLTFALASSALTTTTDAQGHYTLSPARNGMARLISAAAAGYLPFAPAWGESALLFNVRAGQRLEGATIWLHPAHDYSARVIDPQGKPVSKAIVRVLSTAAGEQALMPLVDRYQSDARGELRFHAPEDALLEASHPSFDPGRARVDFAARISRTIEIQLAAKSAQPKADASIAGVVLDAAGRPVDGAIVIASFEPGPRDSIGLLAPALSESDADGRFTMGPMAPGNYRLSARHESYSASSVDGVRAGREDVVIRMADGGGLVGSVRDESGQAILGASVQVFWPRGPLQLELVRAGSFFDPDGAYALSAIPVGSVRVRAGAPGYAPSEELTVEIHASSATRVDVVLLQGARVRGRVVDRQSGAPITDAQVSLEGAASEGMSATPMLARARSDAQGSFVLDGVPSGPRTLFVAAPKHHARIVTGLLVPARGELALEAILLSATEPDETPKVELAGLGAVLRADGEGLRIERLIPGGGGAEAGLVAGDLILSIDGQVVTHLGFDNAIAKIRGPVDSQIVLGVRRLDDTKAQVVAYRRLVRA